MHGDKLQVNWKNFSLEQTNNKQGDDWRIWEQPDDYPSRGLPAFRAAEAARLQGEEAYERMHFALLVGRHENRKDFTEPKDIEEIARNSGLDMKCFSKDIADRDLLKRVEEDHLAAGRYGTFGTPTFVFEDGEPFFMRIKAHEDAVEAAKAFDHVYAMMVEAPNINEIKRPKKPQD